VTDQLRHNADKSQLSYFYSIPGSLIDCPSLQPIVTAITTYLSRNTDSYDSIIAEVEQCIRQSDSTEPSVAYSRVATYGERKYSRGNFILGAPVCSYLDSALRHLEALAAGDKYDAESTEPHIYHVYWNVIEASTQPRHRDNRLPKRPEYDEHLGHGPSTDEVPVGYGCGFEVVRDVEWARAELAAGRGVIVESSDDGQDVGRAWTFRDGKMVAVNEDGDLVVEMYPGAFGRGPVGDWSGRTFGPYDRDFDEPVAYDVPEPSASEAF
jgi:hypothetical protein